MTSKGYWKRRALILEQLVRDKADATVAEIARLYDLAQESIVQQVEKIFDTYAKGGALNEAQARELLSVKQTAEYREELQALYAAATDADVKRDLLARLNAPAYAWRIGRLEALRDRVYAEARMAGLTEVSYVRDRLEDALGFGYYRETYELQRGAGAAYDFTRLSNNQVKAALAQEWNGGNWSSRLWANNKAFATAVEEAVAVGILAGLRYDEMRDNLLRAIGMDATQGAKYRAARLVRTECAYIAGQGQLLGYREAGLESYVFLATLDLRTSEICRSLDMKRFPLKDAQAGENFPPMHPNCRSTTMGALTDEEIARLRRSARDPVTGKVTTVPGNMSYREWYAEYVEGKDSVENWSESGIIQSTDRDVTIGSIDSPIEQRNTGRGNPGAIVHFDVDLSTRQRALLDKLQEYDSRATVPKSDVSMTDLAALTAKTGDEFAMFTRGGERLVVRGNSVMVNITQEEARSLAAAGYTWSGHTHPGADVNVLQPSEGDYIILNQFDQEDSAIYNSAGNYFIFERTEPYA